MAKAGATCLLRWQKTFVQAWSSRFPTSRNTREFTFAYDGQDTIDGEKCDRLRIKHSDGKQEVWSLDQSGKVRRMVAWLSSGEVSTDFSDFRLVDGVNAPFHVAVPEATVRPKQRSSCIRSTPRNTK